MATIDLATKLGNSQAPSVHSVRFPLHYAEVEIDLDDAEAEKGSALAANDIIEAIDVPPGAVILTAGFEVLTAQSGSTVLTLDVGVTDVDADAWVDGFDLVAASAGDYSQNPAAYQPIVVGNTADTVDVLIASLATTNTGGVLRVFAWYLDASDTRRPGIVALKS